MPLVDACQLPQWKVLLPKLPPTYTSCGESQPSYCAPSARLVTDTQPMYSEPLADTLGDVTRIETYCSADAASLLTQSVDVSPSMTDAAP